MPVGLTAAIKGLSGMMAETVPQQLAANHLT